jgi:hypothetical protein
MLNGNASVKQQDAHVVAFVLRLLAEFCLLVRKALEYAATPAERT